MIAQKERQHENIAVEEDQEMQISVHYDVASDHLLHPVPLPAVVRGVDRILGLQDCKGCMGKPLGRL